MTDIAKLIDPRPEGVYCHWESYPPNTPWIKDNILVIERVQGDGSVSRFTCARDESETIRLFLRSDVLSAEEKKDREFLQRRAERYREAYERLRQKSPTKEPR